MIVAPLSQRIFIKTKLQTFDFFYFIGMQK